ncbi:hypothetical protein KAR91_66110, partial [Candidatus Pacearchaeota archaeon]|nr:hypothetical protein [Candidatus Pacearchaeota archaeon]
GDAITYVLDRGDGTQTPEKPVPAGGAITEEYFYGTEGTYTVTLTATDIALSGSHSITVHVLSQKVFNETKETWYSRIQFAIERADDCDTIVVTEGTYYENIDFKGKDITLTSTNPDDPAVVAGTVIKGNGQSSTVTFSGTESATCELTGLTITSGVLDDGLIAHWKFDESSGTIAEDNAGDNDGTVYDSTSWRDADGYIDGALEFDGVNDHVQIEGFKGVTGTNSRTITAWVKPTASGAVISWGKDAFAGGFWYIIVNYSSYGNPNALHLSVWGGQAIGETDLVTDGKWHHIAIVVEDDGSPDCSEVKIYVDGHLETLSYCVAGPINTVEDSDVYIGSRIDGSNYRYKGLIDDVRIYDKGLSDAEIGRIYSEYAKIPVSHWTFDSQNAATPPVSSDEMGINDATIEGDAEVDTTKKIIGSGSLYIDGSVTDDYANILDDDSLTPTDQITLSFWLWNVNNSAYAGIYKYASCPTSRAYYVNARGHISWHVFSSLNEGDTIVSNSTVPYNAWHHVAVTFDRGQAAVYLDGVLDASGQMSVSSIMNDAQPLMIGGYYSYCSGTVFQGVTDCYFDDVRMYDKALTAVEIRDIYNIEKTGGGINGNGTSATISKCVITGNNAENGGGIYDCDGEISMCTIINNTANADGGGLANCDGLISSCLVTDNIANVEGGGFASCGDLSITTDAIINCVIIDNTAIGNGGGLFDCDNIDIVNCTIVDNFASDGGGLNSCDAAITNCVIWGNRDVGGADQSAQMASPGAAVVNNSCIQGGWAEGMDNISGYPSFVSYPEYQEIIANDSLNFRSVYVMDSADYTAGEIIEFNYDGIARTIESIDSGDNILYFDPGLASPATTGMVLYHWKGFSDVVIDLRLRTNSPCLDAGDDSVIDVRFDPAGGTDYRDYEG